MTDVDAEGGTFVVGTIGLVLLASTLWYLDRYGVIADERALTLAPELLEATNVLVIVGFAVALLYGTARLARADLSEGGKWRAGIWCAAGFVGSAVVVAFLQAHWLLDEVVLPTRVLVEHYLVAVGAGSVAGLLVGVNAARTRQSRAAVETQRDAFAVVNAFLRHHVLNGMQVVLGYTDILREDADETEQTYLADIEDRGDEIVSLVQRVNVLMRSIAGETELGPVELDPVLATAVETTREAFPEATVHLEYPGGQRVRADQLLGDVLENVLRSAVEHTDAAVTVTVSVAGTADTVAITVADDRRGHPDVERTESFEPGEPGSETVGRGFGLYLVDVLVDRYGGDVWIEATDPGGAAVVLELPRA